VRINFKRLFSFLLVIMVTMFAVVAFGADPSPIPTGAPGTFSLSWTMLLAALPALAIAILDFIFAVNPNAKSNGFLHWIYLAFGGKETPPAKP
jgi:hypothetical protein